jgi:hypothetical protein
MYHSTEGARTSPHIPKSALPQFGQPIGTQALVDIPVPIAGEQWRFQWAEGPLIRDNKRTAIRIDWVNNLILLDPGVTFGCLANLGAIAVIAIQEKAAKKRVGSF